MFYSGTTRGFYDPNINPNIPQDAVAISDENYASLMAAQAAGKWIEPDKDGNPIAVDPHFSDEQKYNMCKSEAQTRLFKSDWSQSVDVVERLANAKEFADYRAAVRELLFNPVVNPVWPTEPKAVWKE